MQSQNKKILLVIGLFVIVMTIFIIGIFLSRSNRTVERKDNPSGETISSPKDRQTEDFGVQQNEIVFYGIKDLINAGVSDFMVKTFREQLQKYSNEHGKFIKSASVFSDSINLRDTSETERTRYFKVQLNESEDINIELRYTSILSVRMYIYDKSGKLNFESDLIKYDTESEEAFMGDGAPPEELNAD